MSNYHLAQLNIAMFRKPSDHPDNADFVNNLDRINALAEQQSGFVWRLVGDGNDALDIKMFDDPNLAMNMSVWEDMESLAAFVYRNQEHRAIMRRRGEWFEKMDFYLALWWIEATHTPTPEEAIERLEHLKEHGPSEHAFTFKNPFPAPGSAEIKPVLDDCA